MTKHPDGAKGSQRDRPGLQAQIPQMRAGYTAAGSLNVIHQKREHLQYGLRLEGEALAEAYLKGRLEVCFVLAGWEFAARAAFGPVTPAASILENEAGSFVKNDCFRRSPVSRQGKRHEPQEVLPAKRNGTVGGEDELVLVGNVEKVDRLYRGIPARVRLERLHRIDDIFSGQAHLSCLDGRIQFFSAPSPRELHLLGGGGFVTDDGENNHIEGRSKIVNSITDYEAELGWDGFLLFDEMQRLTGCEILLDDEFRRTLREIGCDIPLKFEDVLLCSR